MHIMANVQIIHITLTKEEANHDMRNVYSQDNWSVGSIVNGAKGWRGEKCSLECSLNRDLFRTNDKRCILMHQGCEGMSEASKVFNEYMDNSHSAKVCAYFGEVSTRASINDLVGSAPTKLTLNFLDLTLTLTWPLSEATGVDMFYLPNQLVCTRV